MPGAVHDHPDPEGEGENAKREKKQPTNLSEYRRRQRMHSFPFSYLSFSGCTCQRTKRQPEWHCCSNIGENAPFFAKRGRNSRLASDTISELEPPRAS